MMASWVIDIPDVANVRHSLHSFHCSETEASTLPNDAVFVFEQFDQAVDDILAAGAGTSQGNGRHGTNVGIFVFQQFEESLYHSRVLEFSWKARIKNNNQGLFQALTQGGGGGKWVWP